jgi:hypothetical protein
VVVSINQRYYHAGPENVCAYCGDSADTIDHAVPQSWVVKRLGNLAGHKFPKVSACVLCNSLLGSHVDASWSDRKSRLAGIYHKRGRSLLRTADWTDEELNSFGPALKTYVQKAVMDARNLRGKLVVIENNFWPEDLANVMFFIQIEVDQLPETTEKTCLQCGSLFTPPRSASKFCWSVCREKYLVRHASNAR